MRTYLQHASRHARRGSDPIPGAYNQYALASFDSGPDSGHSQSVPSGGHTTEIDLEWYSFETSDQTVFATHTLPTGGPNNAAGDKWIQLLQPGMYLVYAALVWDGTTFNRYSYITSETGSSVLEQAGLIEGVVEATTSSSVDASYKLKLNPFDMVFLPSDESPGAVKVVAGNEDVSAHNVTAATFGVVYLGGADFAAESDYTIY